MRDSKAVPGAVVAIKTFRDFSLGFHPHLHILVSDGCFHENGLFSVSSAVDIETLEQIFRHKALKILLIKGKITQDMIALLDKWRHSLLTEGQAFTFSAARGYSPGMKRPWKTLPVILSELLFPGRG